jgi:hypothetical protein
VTTTLLTLAELAFSSDTAAANSSPIATESAFRRFGALSVSVATPFEEFSSTKTSFSLAALDKRAALIVGATKEPTFRAKAIPRDTLVNAMMSKHYSKPQMNRA